MGDERGSIALLASECAYEQWHRLLFARFLAENDLLIHPDFRAPVTLAECEELAADLGEPDGWAVAGRFAAQILPGIFRPDDPCVQLRLAPEGRVELEQLVAGLPADLFTADDSLGWVYQFWQKEKKNEVNASDRKIGGADLGPVTQLFTENYMVRFLLENSLGAWWAARHPNSALIKDWVFLRYDEKGDPSAGSFDRWPSRVAAVTVMDPCCGSGHFLIEAFGMLWRMRAEEEGLSPVAAQDAVLRDNLFGLELDPRCVQIAMFAVALTAWKAGSGWRELPVPHVACSGLAVKGPVSEWKALAPADPQLQSALARLHILFRDAETLGSLIDPKRFVEISDPAGLQTSIDDVEWDDIAPLLVSCLTKEASDPALAVLGTNAAGIARAADYLSRRYSLVATNVPFLMRGRQAPRLQHYGDTALAGAHVDLATLMIDRARQMTVAGGGVALVSPQNWTTAMPAFEVFRRSYGTLNRVAYLVRLGAGAFSAITGEVVQPALMIAENVQPSATIGMQLLDSDERDTMPLAEWLQCARFEVISQVAALTKPGAAFAPDVWGSVASLAATADAYAGAQSGDDSRYKRFFWELDRLNQWTLYQTSSNSGDEFGGRHSVIRLLGAEGAECDPGSVIRGTSAWGRSGVAVARTSLAVSVYTGEAFNDSVTVLVPRSPSDLAALWVGVRSDKFRTAVRALSKQLKVGNKIFEKTPFDLDTYRALAQSEYPAGLPKPWSDDPTQWLFSGRQEEALQPLQVGVARLVGYRWPQQQRDDLDSLVDDDGIVCLSSVLGERAAADRLQELLASAFGGAWSPTKTIEMLTASGSGKSDLGSWLREDFFKAHCHMFKNRPLVWQIWDGRKDGFSALANYHRLDRPMLERLTYTYLGGWIERQIAGVRDAVAGAEGRLAAAQDLRRRLELILEGEPPFDIYVRWKSLAEQPAGWDPDLNDGIRRNLRPFVKALVLRSKFKVTWDPDGSDRHNHLHHTLAEKQAARRAVNS